MNLSPRSKVSTRSSRRDVLHASTAICLRIHSTLLMSDISLLNPRTRMLRHISAVKEIKGAMRIEDPETREGLRVEDPKEED